MSSKQFKVVHQPAQSHIQVRSLDWDFSGLSENKKYVWGGMSFQSYVLYTLSLLFPEGERFFIRSAKQLLSRLEDDHLKQEIRAFIGQEAQHGVAHDGLNQELKRIGLDPEPFESLANNWLFTRFEKWHINTFPQSKLRIAMTAAAEHFTATWAMHFLRHADEVGLQDQSIKDLLTWHAVEEIEHKHVCYDAMDAVEVPYLIRQGTMIFTLTVVALVTSLGIVNFAMNDKDFKLGKFMKELWLDVTGQTPFSATKLSLKTLVTYLPFDFHPSHMNHIEEATRYIEDRFKQVS